MYQRCYNKCGSIDLYIKEKKETKQDYIVQIVEHGLNGYQKMKKEYLSILKKMKKE